MKAAKFLLDFAYTPGEIGMKWLTGCVLSMGVSLSSMMSLAAEDETSLGNRPSGILACEGVHKNNDQLTWKTIRLSFNFRETGQLIKDRRYFVGIDGLDYGSGSYLFNRTQIIVYAPETCLLGDEGITFGGCKFVGIIDRVDGSFRFYEGDYTDERKDPFFWSQIKDAKSCNKVDSAF